MSHVHFMYRLQSDEIMDLGAYFLANALKVNTSLSKLEYVPSNNAHERTSV